MIGVETWKGHKEKENRGSHKKTFSLSLNLPSASVSLSCQFTRYTLVDACLYKLVACTHKYIERLPRTFHVARMYYIDIATPRDSRSMIQSNAKVDRNKTLYHDLYRWPNEFQYDPVCPNNHLSLASRYSYTRDMKGAAGASRETTWIPRARGE